MKVNIGLSQKRGLPNYGSAGASCQLEVELDAAMLSQDPDQFQRRVRAAFAACRQAVRDELAEADSAGDASPRPAKKSAPSHPTLAGPSPPRPATANQVKAIRAIAYHAGIDLAAELRSRFGVGSPEAVSLQQASQLIDDLKATQATGSR